MSSKEKQHTMGAGGECICPKCETRIPHQDGVPCHDELCSQCNAKMLRVGSEHYDLWMKKKHG